MAQTIFRWNYPRIALFSDEWRPGKVVLREKSKIKKAIAIMNIAMKIKNNFLERVIIKKPRYRGSLLFYFVYNRFESLRIVHREVSKNLAVQRDACFFHFPHELRVRQTVCSNTRVDTSDPKRAIVAFLCFAVTVSISETFFDSIFRYCPNVFLAAEITFRKFEDAFTSFSRCYIVH